MTIMMLVAGGMVGGPGLSIPGGVAVDQLTPWMVGMTVFVAVTLGALIVAAARRAGRHAAGASGAARRYLRLLRPRAGAPDAVRHALSARETFFGRTSRTSVP